MVNLMNTKTLILAVIIVLIIGVAVVVAIHTLYPPVTTANGNGVEPHMSPQIISIIKT